MILPAGTELPKFDCPIASIEVPMLDAIEGRYYVE